MDVQRYFFYRIVPGVTGCVACWRAQSEQDDWVSAAISSEMTRLESCMQPGERFGQDFAAFGPLVTTHTACLITEFVRVATGLAPLVAPGRMMEVRCRLVNSRVCHTRPAAQRPPRCRESLAAQPRDPVGVSSYGG